MLRVDALTKLTQQALQDSQKASSALNAKQIQIRKAVLQQAQSQKALRARQEGESQNSKVATGAERETGQCTTAGPEGRQKAWGPLQYRNILDVSLMTGGAEQILSPWL